MKTFAVNVERQRRKNYLRISAEIVAIRRPPIFFWDVSGNLGAKISNETTVIAVIFPNNTAERCWISMKRG